MKIYKPTTPSRRSMTRPDYTKLSKVKPKKSLLVKLKDSSGRNSSGRITVRHQGGGNKRRYRLVDFKMQTGPIDIIIETLEYDPYRTAFIALVRTQDGKRSYILAPEKVKVGDRLTIAEQAPLENGNRMMLKNISVGYQVHNIEFVPGRGGQIARSAGSYAEVQAHENGYTNLKMSSGEVRRVSWSGYATIGQVSNAEHNLVSLGKAGRVRHMGVRPTVRGSAMNPKDHPYGGGEGRAVRGTRKPKTKWGKVTGGRKTRKKKNQTSKLILKRRPSRV